MTAVSTRRVVVTTTDGGVEASVEDAYQQFGIRLWHDGARVTELTASSQRRPWSTCAAALAQTAPFIGLELATAGQLSRLVDPAWHCTHVHDLVGLALAGTRRRAGTRSYETATLEQSACAMTALITRDGREVLRWRVRDDTLVWPPSWAGVPLNTGFSRHLAGRADDESEAATILRRATQLGQGAGMDLDLYRRPLDVPLSVAGACRTYQPPIAAGAVRITGSAVRFGPTGGLLTKEMHAFLTSTS